MLANIIVGLVLLALIVWFYEVVLSQRDIEVTVRELVG
jgi:hypothetical protein